MKKVYQKPTIGKLTVDLASLMTTSKVEEGFNLDGAPSTDATYGNLSRRNVWEDEDFEDEEF